MRRPGLTAVVTSVIVQAGLNDIFTLNPAEEVTVEQIVQGHRQLIRRAHGKGLKLMNTSGLGPAIRNCSEYKMHGAGNVRQGATGGKWQGRKSTPDNPETD